MTDLNNLRTFGQSPTGLCDARRFKNWWARQDCCYPGTCHGAVACNAIRSRTVSKLIPAILSLAVLGRDALRQHAVQDRSRRSCVDLQRLQLLVQPADRELVGPAGLLRTSLYSAPLGPLHDQVGHATSKIAPCNFVEPATLAASRPAGGQRNGGPGRTRTCNQEIMSLLH